MQNPKRRETVFIPAHGVGLLLHEQQQPLCQFYGLICLLDTKTVKKVPM